MTKKTIDGYYYDGKNSYTLYKDEYGKAYTKKKTRGNKRPTRRRNISPIKRRMTITKILI